MEHISMDGHTQPDLSSDEWEWVYKTPAGGDEFYNRKLQQIAVKYPHCIRVYVDLVNPRPAAKCPFPADFAKCLYFPEVTGE